MKQITLTLTFVVIAGLLAGCKQQEQKQSLFSNPVIKGDLADPSIIRYNEMYYATGTSSEWAPFYPVFASKDLINWQQSGYLFNEQPEWTSSSFWAPELFVYNNKVYAYYTARNKAGVSYIGVATADHPTGAYTDHGLIVEFGSEAIDAFILEDNGELYISWKAYGLDQRPIELLGCKLTDDGLHLDGEPFTLMRDDENIGMEGQHWMKKGDYYYIIYSTFSCCGPKSDYQVFVARSKNLKGPYEKYTGNPILYGDGEDILSIGHGTITTTPDGRMFYFCHAYLAGDRFYGGRQGYLTEMVINEDNWVHIPTGNIAHIQGIAPFEGTIQEPLTNFEDDFQQTQLADRWAWNYGYSDIKANVGNGILQLSGNPIETNTTGTVLCFRAVAPVYTYDTQVVNQNNSFKGLTMYGDSKNLVAIGSQDNKLILKEVRDGEETILHEQTLPYSSPYLKIEVINGCNCTFLWSSDGKTWNQLENISSQEDYSYLVRWDRVARPGLIHSGDPEQPAEFSYFKSKNQI